MYKINPALEPRCTHDDNMIKNNIQLGATGDVRPCNFYGSRLNWQKLEKWCEQKGLNLAKLNIKIVNIIGFFIIIFLKINTIMSSCKFALPKATTITYIPNNKCGDIYQTPLPNSQIKN